MPLLRRHSSAGEFTDVCVEEPAHFSGMSREMNSSSSPPRLQRVAIPVGTTGIQTQPGRVETCGSRGENTHNHLEASGSRYSPNFPSHPPILVRHSTGHPEVNVSLKSSLQNDALTPGSDTNRRQPSPFVDLASSKRGSVQSFQESSYARAIPVAEPLVSARHSPLFMSNNKDKYKSIYVFSNRQTFVQPENEPRPVRVSSLVMPNKNGLTGTTCTPNHSEDISMRFQSIDGFGRSGERQFSRSLQSQYAGPSSSSYIHRDNAGVMSANRQFNNSSMGFKRIPSPRSDLFSGISPQPVNTACMSHVNASSLGVFSSGNQPTALRSNIQQKENAPESLPPAWSHLESPYSIPSTAARNSSPKPYSFSVNFSQSSRLSGTYSMSHANSNAATLEGYSLGPMQDRQHVSVIQRTSVGKGEPLNSMRRELCVGEQENFRAYRLPKAFQGGDSRSDSSSSNAVFNALPDASAREHLMRRQPYLNDHSTGNLNNREASIPLVHLTIPARPPSSDSPSSTGSRKNIVSDSTVTGSTAAKSSSSSPKIVKKSLSSKGKETVYPSLEKTNGSPVFHPSEEEFRDPISYIKMISRDAAKFGLCVIVPPESWKVCI